MPADPPDTDPADRQPEERGLQRRSGSPAVSPWVVIGLILILGALAYAISAVTAG